MSVRPVDLAEALILRDESGALPFAGGTDLMVRHRAKNGMGPSFQKSLLFVDHLPELRRVKWDHGELEIGAAVPMAVLADDPRARKDALRREEASEEALSKIPSLLRDAAFDLGAPALRTRATPGGNVANASPAGDVLTALVALDARVILAHRNGERELPVLDFTLGPGKTQLAQNELIRAFRFPVPETRWCYWRKVGTRRANALTKVSLGAFGTIQNGTLESLSLAFGAVGPRIVLADDAAKMLLGFSEKDFESSDGKTRMAQAQKLAAQVISPIDDQRSTAHYRKTVALNLFEEALRALAKNLKENTDD
ncbi:MAG: FAD binding domain-containing protein [Spirochaetales bacterium]|nr:FAD binding domain-containing protein [Spirochaetales bacterium]